MKRQSVETLQVDAIRINQYDGVVVTAVIPFRFQGPGPRVMLTVKLLVKLMGALPPIDWTFGTNVQWSLWLYRSMLTNDGQRVPVQNIIGTRAAPQRLDNGTNVDSVNGTSLDWIGGGDGIDGELTVFINGTAHSPNLNPVFGSLRGHYNAVAPLCDEEWALIDAKAGASPDVGRLRSFG